MSLREIVQDDNPRVRVLQMANGVGTDMAGSAGDADGMVFLREGMI